MGTGLQHDMASRDGLAQKMSDLAPSSAFNQNFHLTCIIHQWGRKNCYRYSNSSFFLYAEALFKICGNKGTAGWDLEGW